MSQTATLTQVLVYSDSLTWESFPIPATASLLTIAGPASSKIHSTILAIVSESWKTASTVAALFGTILSSLVEMAASAFSNVLRFLRPCRSSS